MQDLKPKSGKKEPKTYINQNPLESLLDIGKGVRRSIVDEVGKAGAHDAWEQIVRQGQSHESKKAGELAPGQEIDFTMTIEKATQVTAMGHEFTSELINAGRKASQESSQQLQVKYNEVLIELKALGKSSKELKAQVEILTVEQAPEEIGIYHTNFVEKLLLRLREARESVDDGLAWFKALRAKNASRQYRAMAKRGGTSFTLSNERTSATQAG